MSHQKIRQQINDKGKKLLQTKSDSERELLSDELREIDPDGIELLSMIRDVFRYENGVLSWGWTDIKIGEKLNTHKQKVIKCAIKVLNKNMGEFLDLWEKLK